jgi:hypothetical protein
MASAFSFRRKALDIRDIGRQRSPGDQRKLGIRRGRPDASSPGEHDHSAQNTGRGRDRDAARQRLQHRSTTVDRQHEEQHAARVNRRPAASRLRQKALTKDYSIDGRTVQSFQPLQKRPGEALWNDMSYNLDDAPQSAFGGSQAQPAPVDGGERSALSPPLKDAHDTSRCVNQTKAVRLFPSVPCGNRVRLGPGGPNNVCDVSQY